VISIVRAEGPVHLPAEFQLLLTANSCRCGRLGLHGVENACLCSPEEINRYWRKFGGALLDRVEIRTAVLPPKIEEMGIRNNSGDGEKSAVIAKRVKAAVEIQRIRFKGTGIRRNAMLPAGKTAALCPMSEKAENAFHAAISKLGFPAELTTGFCE